MGGHPSVYTHSFPREESSRITYFPQHLNIATGLCGLFGFIANIHVSFFSLNLPRFDYSLLIYIMAKQPHSLRRPSTLSPKIPPFLPPKAVPLSADTAQRRHSKPILTGQYTMENVNIPSENVPEELRAPCEQTLKRAKELRKAEPVVAYWCTASCIHKTKS